MIDVLVNWSLVKEAVRVTEDHVNLNFTDGTTITYANSMADVEGAIRKAERTKDPIAKVRKPKIAKTCPDCECDYVKCPSCGAKAFCAAECMECRVCGYVSNNFDEVDAAQE